MTQDNITRRRFVVGMTGALPAPWSCRVMCWAGPATSRRARRSTSPSSAAAARARRRGEILAGGQNIVALADVDFGYVDAAMAGRPGAAMASRTRPPLKLQEAYGKAKRYDDYRKMLEEQKDIDGVVVATPDHTHAVVAKAAMELGKHVYCEKPLTWSVHEARVFAKTASRTKVVTQMGNQGHSSEGAARSTNGFGPA